MNRCEFCRLPYGDYVGHLYDCGEVKRRERGGGLSVEDLVSDVEKRERESYYL